MKKKRWLVTVVYMKQFEIDAEDEDNAYVKAEQSNKLKPKVDNMCNWYVREIVNNEGTRKDSSAEKGI